MPLGHRHGKRGRRRHSDHRRGRVGRGHQPDIPSGRKLVDRAVSANSTISGTALRAGAASTTRGGAGRAGVSRGSPCQGGKRWGSRGHDQVSREGGAGCAAGAACEIGSTIWWSAGFLPERVFQAAGHGGSLDRCATLETCRDHR